MTHSTLTSKNQTTIPKAVVHALKLKPADQLVYEIEDGRVILTAKTGTFASVAEELAAKSRKGGPHSIEEMNAAVKQMAGKRYARSKS